MPRSRDYIVRALRLLTGVAVLAFVLSWVDARSLLRALASMNPVHFIGALASALASSIVVPAIITRRTLRVAGMRIGLAELVRINLIIRFYVLVLPTPITVGMRWLQYRGSAPGKGWQVAALIAFERVVQGMVVLVGTFLFLLVAGSSVPRPVRFLLPLSGGLSVAALGVLMLFLSERAFSITWPFLMMCATRLPHFISSRLGRLAEAIKSYHSLPHREVGSIVLWTATADALAVVTAVVVSRGLTIELGIADIAWMRSTVFLLSLLPITVGGLGIREAGYATLLRLYGVEPSAALAFPLVLLSLTLLIGLSGSILEGIRLSSARASEMGTDRV